MRVGYFESVLVGNVLASPSVFILSALNENPGSSAARGHHETCADSVSSRKARGECVAYTQKQIILSRFNRK